MKKKTTKGTKEIGEIYHEEIIVKPAKRLLEALLKAEKKEMSTFAKIRKVSISSK